MAARPATRRHVERTVDPSQRPIVRDLGRGSSSFTIEWDVRPAFDFLFSLSGEAGSTDDLPAEDRRWLTESRAALPADAQAGIVEMFDSELCINTGVLLIDRPDVRTSAEFVELLATSEPLSAALCSTTCSKALARSPPMLAKPSRPSTTSSKPRRSRSPMSSARSVRT